MKNMNSTNKQSSGTSRPWVDRLKRGHWPDVDYISKLRAWWQDVRSEAEEKKNLKKKGQFLCLLKDFKATGQITYA